MKVIFLGVKKRNKKTGVGKYNKDLIEMLNENPLINADFYYVPDSKYKIGRFLINYIYYPFSLLFFSKKNFYIISNESCAFYSLFLFSKRYALIVHDLRNHDLFKAHLSSFIDYLSYLQVKFLRVKNCIVPSKFTKEAVIALTDKSKPILIPNVFDSSMYKAEGRKFSHTNPLDKGNSENYILYVGSGEPRKNFKTVLKVAQEAYINFGLKLYTVGISEDVVSGYEFCISYYNISDIELSRLYENAFCLINASLYEGFGRVIIEAQSQGCPVISTKESALAEILGNSGLKINNPLSLNEYLSAIEKLFDFAYRQEMIKNGFENALKYKNNSSRVNELYKLILSK
ncbi:glycosyltransferase [Photorhabdus caribbeanensis]|uniref:glycosyltransferase n=1 Tax=Photorhabdus caribbeanensis TaxID=1004165 RepID=UPI001BD4402D|nr:glycosyltransferase [Photorhabdus caribbeanensis]MBS9423352.1 glycosyltransferase [Photorhabdus caribbeanensis]